MSLLVCFFNYKFHLAEGHGLVFLCVLYEKNISLMINVAMKRFTYV